MSRPRIAILSLILCMAALVRFHGLADQGFFMSDEAAFALEADKLARSVDMAVRRVPGEGGPFEGTVRPFHMILLALMPDTTSVLYFSALCGVLTVAFVALLARGMADAPDSLAPELAALLLATSPSHVFFSRMLAPEASAICLMCAALVVYLADRGNSIKRLAASGFIFGLAYGLQPRMTFPALFFIAAEFAARRDARRILILCSFLALPLVVMEGLYSILGWAHRSMGSTYYPHGYLAQYINMEGIARMVPRLNRIEFMFDYLRKVESLPYYILFFIALLAAALRRKYVALGVGLCALFIFLAGTIGDQVLFSGKRWGRMLQPGIVLGCALVGSFLADRARGSFSQKLAAIALVLLAIGLRAEILAESIVMKSDAERVMKEAYRRAPSPTMFSEDDNLLTWHLRGLPPHIGFYPGLDTATVIIFDREYASQFGFLHLLPDTPTFLLEDNTMKPRILYLETFGRAVDLERFASIPPRPAQVYVLPKHYQRPDRPRSAR